MYNPTFYAAGGPASGMQASGHVPVSSTTTVHFGAGTNVPSGQNVALPHVRSAPTGTPAESQVGVGVTFSLGK